MRKRVVAAAEAALHRQQYVSAIDVFVGSGMIEPAQVASWRKGQLDFLERAVRANLAKISRSMAMFREWAREKRLKPSETRYIRRTRSGTADLRFSKSGHPGIEKNYRTHFVSPALSERKQQRLSEKTSSPPPEAIECLPDTE